MRNADPEIESNYGINNNLIPQKRIAKKVIKA